MENPSYSSTWSWEQEKAFENALAIHGDDSMSDKWEKIAAEVPGKTVEDIKKHYDILVEDIEAIESGRVPLPCYESSPEGSADLTDEGANGDRGKKGVPSGSRAGDSSNGGKASKSENERRKGIAWTEDEHRLFLLGLDKYGKGDWRSISRNFVITRTPTQVASHAQKYFIRLNSMNKDRRRSSIHDITTVGSGDTPAHQGPITGLTGMAVASSKSGKPSSHPPPGPPGVGVYGTPTLGQPIGGPLVSAVGTPVNPHMAYGLRAPIAGTVVPGAPVNIPSGTYPMPHQSTPR